MVSLSMLRVYIASVKVLAKQMFNTIFAFCLYSQMQKSSLNFFQLVKTGRSFIKAKWQKADFHKAKEACMSIVSQYNWKKMNALLHINAKRKCLRQNDFASIVVKSTSKIRK